MTKNSRAGVRPAKKKKIVAGSIFVGLAATAIFGGTLAQFTDRDTTATQTLQAGTVDVDVEEGTGWDTGALRLGIDDTVSRAVDLHNRGNLAIGSVNLSASVTDGAASLDPSAKFSDAVLVTVYDASSASNVVAEAPLSSFQDYNLTLPAGGLLPGATRTLVFQYRVVGTASTLGDYLDGDYTQGARTDFATNPDNRYQGGETKIRYEINGIQRNGQAQPGGEVTDDYAALKAHDFSQDTPASAAAFLDGKPAEWWAHGLVALVSYDKFLTAEELQDWFAAANASGSRSVEDAFATDVMDFGSQAWQDGYLDSLSVAAFLQGLDKLQNGSDGGAGGGGGLPNPDGTPGTIGDKDYQNQTPEAALDDSLANNEMYVARAFVSLITAGKFSSQKAADAWYAQARGALPADDQESLDGWVVNIAFNKNDDSWGPTNRIYSGINYSKFEAESYKLQWGAINTSTDPRTRTVAQVKSILSAPKAQHYLIWGRVLALELTSNNPRPELLRWMRANWNRFDPGSADTFDWKFRHYQYENEAETRAYGGANRANESNNRAFDFTAIYKLDQAKVLAAYDAQYALLDPADDPAPTLVAGGLHPYAEVDGEPIVP